MDFPNDLNLLMGATVINVPEPKEDHHATPKDWVQEHVQATVDPGKVVYLKGSIVDDTAAQRGWSDDEKQAKFDELYGGLNLSSKQSGHVITADDNGVIMIPQNTGDLIVLPTEGIPDGFKFCIRGRGSNSTELRIYGEAVFDPAPVFENHQSEHNAITVTGKGSAVGLFFASAETTGGKPTWFTMGLVLADRMLSSPIPGEVKFVAFYPDADKSRFVDAHSNLWYIPNGGTIGPYGTGADLASDLAFKLYTQMHPRIETAMVDGQPKSSAKNDWNAKRLIRPVNMLGRALFLGENGAGLDGASNRLGPSIVGATPQSARLWLTPLIALGAKA